LVVVDKGHSGSGEGGLLRERKKKFSVIGKDILRKKSKKKKKVYRGSWWVLSS